MMACGWWSGLTLGSLVAGGELEPVLDDREPALPRPDSII